MQVPDRSEARKSLAKIAKNAKAGKQIRKIRFVLFFLGGLGERISSETQFYNATGAPLVSDR